MAKTTVYNVTLLFGCRDLSGVTNSFDPGESVDEKEVTNFASAGFREYKGGLKAARWQYAGFWEAAGSAGEPDASLTSNLGTSGMPATAIFANPAVDGDIAWFASMCQASYSPRGQVGEVAGYQLNLMSTAPFVRGRVLDTRTATTTGNGAALNLGAVSATQRLYYALHPLAVTGTTPTFDPVIESDNGAGFGSPVTVATLTQVTAATFAAGTAWQYGTVDGPITDTHYRLARTLGGVDPSFQYVAVLGIGPKP